MSVVDYFHASVNNEGMDGYVSTTEAAQIIGCAQSRIRQLLIAKKLVGEKVGRDWLVQRASAEQYRGSAQGRGFPRGKTRTPGKPKGKKP